MRYRISQWLAGRYGMDPLNRALSVFSCVLFIASLFLRGDWSRLLLCVGLISLIYCYVRMMSKNFEKRQSENQKYMSFINKITVAFRLRKERWRQRSEYKFFRCPSCHTMLRVPKGKGRINIVCCKCGTSFQGKT
jgi:hypothetical protein